MLITGERVKRRKRMRPLLMATVALVGAAVNGLSLASAEPITQRPCIQDVYGRVACGPAVDFYPNGRYDDQYYYPFWPVGFGYCPPGAVLGVAACIPWRKPLG